MTTERRWYERYRLRPMKKKNENLSLYVMCFFLLASLAFLAQQISAYH
jgi:hypothetical protein